ncbi:helix-turn-helix transcriptional regulator [Acerihabitans arboris]|uniref:Helix-turn-helix domain-containing protein n=1 Tax=Acerihabitans arboris TaxID=2691583 RepID=A0A845SDX9_9GAMM|nr:helix-turn-helix transcriptional regulator [Acerihabitans arboris]NDL63000.1 helix-turn-helix domain-containing protein [Acerihabitans arboris]
MAISEDGNLLGNYLRYRRTRLDASRLGYPMSRRRTPGLRREEVAQRANVSVTWYTWLEQGRGGAPSAEVLDRLARALELTDVEREHLFLLAQNRPPEIDYPKSRCVSPQLQRVLDSLEFIPAYVKTAEWDIIAWNRAAVVVLADYATLPEAQRNILRMIFCKPGVQAKIPNWESVARFVVATFRAETARTGFGARAKALVDELGLSSPEFRELWRDQDVGLHGEGTKYIQHSTLGLITLEYSAFAVDGKPDLGMVIYNPATAKDRAGVRALMEKTLPGQS